MRSLVAALTLSLFTSAAQAVVLHDQPLDIWGGGGWCSPCTGDLDNYDYRVFGSFTLANDSILQSGTFAIADISLGLDDLNISIWDVPLGTELFSVDVPGGSYTKVPNPDDFSYYAVVDLPNWPLAAGSYWVSVFGTNGNTLAWGADFGLGGDDEQYTFGGSVLNSDIYVGFSLSGLVVPEPGSLTLLGLGLLGLGFLRRRS